MPREHNNRPRKPSTKKPPSEGFNERSDVSLGADGEGIDLRAGQHRQELGRNPRVAPSPVNEAMSRYKKSQAKKFSEHTPEAIEARNAGAPLTAVLPDDDVQPNPVLQGSAVTVDEPVSFGEAKQGRGKKPRKPDKSKPTDDNTPNNEHRPQGDKPFGISTNENRETIRQHTQPKSTSASNVDKPMSAKESTIDESPKTVGRQSNDTASTKSKPLSHERPSPLKQERERLSHKRTPLAPATPISPKSNKPNYRKGVNPAPAPTDANQKPHNDTFDDSPKTSPLVHDVVAMPVAPVAESEVVSTDSDVRVLDTDADNAKRDTPIDAPVVADTKAPVNPYTKKFKQGKTQDLTSNVTSEAVTVSVENTRLITPAADVIPPTDISPTHGNVSTDAGSPAVSSGVDAEQRTADKPTEAADRVSPDAISDDDGGGKKKDSKLKFDNEADSSDSAKPSDHAKSGRKLEKAERKVERSSKKLQTAKDKLPTKRKLHTNKEFDSEKGKMKPRLRFEPEVKTQHEHLKGPLITRPLKFGANAAVGFAHTKVFQVQEENVGVKAAHKGEMLAEGGLRYAYRQHKLAPYRKVQKLEERTRKLSVKASYRKALHDNPELRKKPIARLMQKRRIKRDYAKVARDAKRAGTKVGATIKKSNNIIQHVTTTLVKVIKKNPKYLAILGLVFLMIVMIFGLVSSCAGVASSVGQSFAAIAYLAEEECIDDASVFYSYLEADLRQQIINIEDDWPDIDEFRLDIGAFGHCPFVLMAYLTAVHHDFTFAEIEDVLREIFAEQYSLDIVPEVEIRTRVETRTSTGVDGDGYSYTYTFTVVVEYEWHILNVTLTSRSFSEVINARMGEGQRQHHALLMQSRGLRQIVLSPFDFYWMPFVSSHYGWRIHPISGNKQLHRGIDIALPTGTPILAATSGTVTFAGDMGGFGLVVFIDDGDGIVTVYAHCDTLLVSTGQTVEVGDVIATVGSTGDSTGPHLHFEIIKNGRHLNPGFFAFANTF